MSGVAAAARETLARLIVLWCCALLPMLFFRSADGTKWLSLGYKANVQQPPAGGIRKWCTNVGGAETEEQRAVCMQHPYIMPSIARGAALGLAECHHQFRNSRWNCSTAEPRHRDALSAVLKQGTRETGFVHAITAAAVAHAITKTCSQGLMKQCGCDSSKVDDTLHSVEDTPDGGVTTRVVTFRWGGCSDNVAYGVLFSRAYTDTRESGTARAHLNLHNNEVGRKAVEASMAMECKCHGISGSCEYKTCWRALPQFRHIGDVLKKKYNIASEVVAVPRSNVANDAATTGFAAAANSPSATISLPPSPLPKRQPRQKQQPPNHFAYRLVAANPNYAPPTANNLVYSEDSPNHCEADDRRGSLGTRGRSCDRLSTQTESCDLMCCGRGYTNKKRRVDDRCDCKFHWCCEVRCKTCQRDVEEHHCL